MPSFSYIRSPTRLSTRSIIVPEVTLSPTSSLVMYADDIDVLYHRLIQDTCNCELKEV